MSIRRLSARAVLAASLGCLFANVALAKPRPSLADEFRGDRYAARVAQGANSVDVARAVRCSPLAACARSSKTKRKYRNKRLPGSVAPLTLAQGLKREIRRALPPSKSLAGVVAPLAAKAREICDACGARVISSIRHTYIAGTGGRLSLHASGRAVDIQGNPACIYSHLHGWPGGYSVDYARVRHVHISYAPNGPEWGVRFNHYRGGRRHRYARRRA